VRTLSSGRIEIGAVIAGCPWNTYGGNVVRACRSINRLRFVRQ